MIRYGFAHLVNERFHSSQPAAPRGEGSKSLMLLLRDSGFSLTGERPQRLPQSSLAPEFSRIDESCLDEPF